MSPMATAMKTAWLALALAALAAPVRANELWVAPAKNPADRLVADFAVAQEKTHFGFGVPDNFTGFTKATVLLIGSKDQDIRYDLKLSISQNLGSARAFVTEMRGISASVLKGQLLELDVSAIFGGAPALQPGTDYVSLSVDIDNRRPRRRGEREDEDDRSEDHTKDTDKPRALLFGLRFQYEGSAGPQGPAGPQGAPGTNGISTLLTSTPEPGGPNCAAGGVKLSFGADTNRNNVLDLNEVSGTSYVCNGASGCTSQTPMNGDGCCPAGANANNDSDCPPRCGNVVVEQGEQCDDGNMNDTDACSNTCMLNGVAVTAFRMSDLYLRDPHVFVNFLGCRDVTDTELVGFSVNGELQTNIQTDGDSDRLLDQSIAAVFRPLNQSAATNALEIHFPPCTTPLASTTCSRAPSSAPLIQLTSTNMTMGQCLSAIAGTTRPYTPAIISPPAPCFSSNSASVTIDLGGIPITLREARIAATYSGAPASNLVNGLLIGFISEADANNTIIPASFPLVGGQTLSSLLPGGNANCASFSDLDINAGVRGWWFYLNFRAPRVTWVDN